MPPISIQTPQRGRTTDKTSLCHTNAHPAYKKEAAQSRPLFIHVIGEALLGLDRNNRDDLAVLDELHLALLKGEEREVATASDVSAGVDLGTALADDDGTCLEKLAVIRLDAEVLGVGIASVAS